MSNDYEMEQILREKCKIHYGDGRCDGPIQTRRSVLGAVQRACWKAWNQPFEIVTDERGAPRTVQVDLNGWPTILKTEAW